MIKTKAYSPLRYPGGKAVISDYLRSILLENRISEGTYFELYAGGAGAAFELLFSNSVNNIVLNDADFHIFAFWNSVLNDTQRFIEKIKLIDIDIETWYNQRDVYQNYECYSEFDVGFATFFLNRCNRSGILSKAGPIGGFNQLGNYKIGARFNKLALIDRIIRIASFRESIELYNIDTIDFINQNIDKLSNGNAFIYLDPPYYNKGQSLYLNYYKHSDHEKLRDLLSQIKHLNWVVTYDDTESIHKLYKEFNISKINLRYSLQNKVSTSEVFIYSDSIVLPK